MIVSYILNKLAQEDRLIANHFYLFQDIIDFLDLWMILIIITQFKLSVGYFIFEKIGDIHNKIR